MTKRKSPVNLPPREIKNGKQYPGVRGKVVDWVDQRLQRYCPGSFEDPARDAAPGFQNSHRAENHPRDNFRKT
jgi:hypothetical protein